MMKKRKLPIHRSNHFNFFLATEDHREVRRLRLNRGQVRLIIGFASLAVFLAVSSMVGFWYYHSLYARFAQERQANLEFAHERQTLLSKIDNLEATVDSAKKFANQLAALVGTERPNLQKGIGPLTPASSGIRGRTESVTWNYLSEKTGELEVDAKSIDLRIQELLKLQEKKIHYLASTPSIWPVRGWVTSEFGYRHAPGDQRRQFHRGIDIGSRWGSEIIAPAAGVIRYAGYKGGLGRVVEIDHGYGVRSVFAHASSLLVNWGQVVKRGDPVARVGSSGHSTGPHLHYEIHVDGIPVDPMKFVVQFDGEQKNIVARQ